MPKLVLGTKAQEKLLEIMLSTGKFTTFVTKSCLEVGHPFVQGTWKWSKLCMGHLRAKHFSFLCGVAPLYYQHDCYNVYTFVTHLPAFRCKSHPKATDASRKDKALDHRPTTRGELCQIFWRSQLSQFHTNQAKVVYTALKEMRTFKQAVVSELPV